MYEIKQLPFHLDFAAGLFSIVFGLLPIIFYDSYAIWTGGFFQGYTVFVWIIISIQVHGLKPRKFFLELKKIFFSNLRLLEDWSWPLLSSMQTVF